MSLTTAAEVRHRRRPTGADSTGDAVTRAFGASRNRAGAAVLSGLQGAGELGVPPVGSDPGGPCMCHCAVRYVLVVE